MKGAACSGRGVRSSFAGGVVNGVRCEATVTCVHDLDMGGRRGEHKVRHSLFAFTPLASAPRVIMGITIPASTLPLGSR